MRFLGWRRGLAGFLFAFLLAATSAARAGADTQSIDTTGSPVVFAQLQAGVITVHTWNRSDVQIDADPTVNFRHVDRVPPNLPPAFTFFAQTIDTPDGPLVLPPEPFLIQPLDASPHDAVVFDGYGNLTITVPSGTPLLVTRVGQGEVSIDGYHGGTFFSTVRGGMLRLNDVSGTGGLQVNNGPVIVRNSTFDRVRARTGRGSMFFENCNARQIEATSLTGSIIYDNGSFQPGLARFESERGNIALGIARGGAQIDAHSGNGRVLSEGSFQSGPVVTATSGRGAVMYYNGSIRAHPNLRRELPIRAERPKGMRPMPVRTPRTPSRMPFGKKVPERPI
ncbi:MAG: hypothetical protein JO322_12530 [Candidatus Eremiobacteraeota bacterium]|nr:hypothetical protein [Candidatus Eremiobacteraeota bacterium]